MPLPPHNRTPAGARRAVSGPAGGRPPLSQADRLDDISARLDELVRDVRCIPARSHRETERRIAEAEDIATELRAIFRGTGRPQAAPLEHRGGRAWW
jgi:hypothetical protein